MFRRKKQKQVVEISLTKDQASTLSTLLIRSVGYMDDDSKIIIQKTPNSLIDVGIIFPDGVDLTLAANNITHGL